MAVRSVNDLTFHDRSPMDLRRSSGYVAACRTCT